MLVSAEQSRKAEFPIDVKLSGSVMLVSAKHPLYSLFINNQCFIIKTVEIDTSNFKNDSKNGDLTYLTFV